LRIHFPALAVTGYDDKVRDQLDDSPSNFLDKREKTMINTLLAKKRSAITINGSLHFPAFLDHQELGQAYHSVVVSIAYRFTAENQRIVDEWKAPLNSLYQHPYILQRNAQRLRYEQEGKSIKLDVTHYGQHLARLVIDDRGLINLPKFFQTILACEPLRRLPATGDPSSLPWQLPLFKSKIPTQASPNPPAGMTTRIVDRVNPTPISKRALS
jgi:hypothetical protein